MILTLFLLFFFFFSFRWNRWTRGKVISALAFSHRIRLFFSSFPHFKSNCVYVCERACVRACVCVCVERERERERECVCVCLLIQVLSNLPSLTSPFRQLNFESAKKSSLMIEIAMGICSLDFKEGKIISDTVKKKTTLFHAPLTAVRHKASASTG
jgi:hypothetical protein